MEFEKNKVFYNFVKITLVLVCMIIINSQKVNAMPINSIVQYVIDNDTNESDYDNSSIGSWSYITNTGLYSGDARIISSEVKNNYYRWEWSEYVKSEPIYATLSVYLNNVNFTDPAAQYTLSSNVSYMEQLVGTLNQKYATSGWTSFSLVTLDFGQISGYNATHFASVTTSGNSGQTGADAIRITLN